MMTGRVRCRFGALMTGWLLVQSPSPSKVPLNGEEESYENANRGGVPEGDETGPGLHRGGLPQEGLNEVANFMRLDQPSPGGLAELLEISDVGGRFCSFEILPVDHEAGAGLLAIREGGLGAVAADGPGGELRGVGIALRVGGEGEPGRDVLAVVEDQLGSRGGWFLAIEEEAEGEGLPEGEVGGVGLEGVVGAGRHSAVGEEPQDQLIPEEVVDVVVGLALGIEDPLPEVGESQREGLPTAEPAVDDCDVRLGGFAVGGGEGLEVALRLVGHHLREALAGDALVEQLEGGQLHGAGSHLDSRVPGLVGPTHRFERRGSGAVPCPAPCEHHDASMLVDELFELSKLEANKRPLNLEPLAIDDLIHDITHNLKIEAKEKGVELNPIISKALPQVKADIALIDRVLQNLISNSIKFCSEGDSVRVSADQSGENVLISVTDTGEGIDSNELPKIFNRFHRGETTKAGTGLGLAIVKNVLELHGSEYNIESEKGKGTTFTFSLPICTVAQQENYKNNT